MAYMHHKYRAGDSTNLVDVLQIPHQQIVRTPSTKFRKKLFC